MPVSHEPSTNSSLLDGNLPLPDPSLNFKIPDTTNCLLLIDNRVNLASAWVTGPFTPVPILNIHKSPGPIWLIDCNNFTQFHNNRVHIQALLSRSQIAASGSAYPF